MNFILKIKSDNDAFQPEPNDELASILRVIADELTMTTTLYNTIRDINGNSVGYWRLTKR